MEQIVIYLLMEIHKFVIEIHKFKAKDSEVVAAPLCIGNLAKDWTVDNMKKNGLNGYVYDFSVDYDDILDIHKNLMKKIKWYKSVCVY